LLVGRAYPRVGHVTLIEPNPEKLARAEERLREALPASELRVVRAALGVDHALPKGQATLAMAGSVLMPTMELGGGTLEDGRQWLRAALADIRELLQPGAPFYDIETLAAPWARGGARDPVRRLDFRELVQELEEAGFVPVDCVYRFRDRVVLRAERPLWGAPAPNIREGSAPLRSA